MNWILYALFVCLSLPALAQRSISITDLRTENLTNPEGITRTTPRFSWILSSNQRSLQQSNYQILVASTLDKLNQNQGDLWNSGDVTSDRSQWVPYAGSTLTSRQVCYWKVKIRSKDGVESGWSQPAQWSMGLLQSGDWSAQWIGLEQAFEWDAPRAVNTRLSARYFRKQANLAKSIQQATAYISGVGLYEFSLNGRKVGDAVLAPGPTEYDKRVLYNTYDVTDYLQTGDNAFGVTLGNGRYFTVRVGQLKVPATTHYGYPKMRLQVEVTYTDGTTERIVSDNTWKVTADGPIRANNEFDGEEYDATRELINWDKTGYNTASWLTAPVVSAPASRLESQTNPPIRVTQNLTPVSVRQIAPGKYIFDMGQNMVGWARLNVQGPRGTQVTMRFAETLKSDGNLFTDNLRSAEAKDIYTLKGEGQEVWEPRFTYHGFRYIELTGFPGTPTTQTLEGRIVHDDLPQTGTFTTSNELLNRIYQNAFWSVRGNYRGIPTDCPQRDERQGWLGDRANVSTGESFMYGNQSLYAKWLDDIESAQKGDGAIPDIVPTYWKYTTPSVTWPSAYLFIANMLYEQFGDDEPIRKHYASMKRWLTYLERYSTNYIQQADEYGDWALPPEAMNMTKSDDPARKTDGTLLNTAYYYKMLKLMEQFAVMTGNESDRAAFSSRAALVRTAFNQKFLNPATNQYSNNTVTANVVALACGLVPDDRQEAVFNQITAVIEGKYNGHISTGIIGTQWLMRTLTANGRADLAYRLATNTAYPSWGYMVQNGATTTWELWNGNKAPSTMNSGNHVMLLGDMPIWLYENLAGIKAGEAGFKSIEMRPVPVGNLNRVSSTFASAYGPVASEWTVSNQQFRWKITVPGNTTALVAVPADNLASVREGNQPADEANGVTFLRMENGRAVFRVGSGSYDFLSTPSVLENRPPVAPGFSPPAGLVNKSYTYTLPAFTDPEGGTVTHALNGSVAGLTFNPTTRVLSGTPTQPGSFPLVVRATDTQGASTTAVMTVVIAHDISNYDGYLDKVRCDSITGWAWLRDKPNFAVTVEFLDGPTLETATFLASTPADIYRQDLKNAGKGNGAHGYALKVPESIKDNQKHTIWGRVDGIFVLKWAPKTLTCEASTTPPINQAPVAPPVASLTATSGQTFTTTLPAFSDSDNDPLTYTLAGSVPGLSFSAQNRVLSGTPTTTGTFSLTYAATDGMASASAVFAVTISELPVVNTPPVAPSIASMTATTGQPFTTTLPAFTDSESDPLTHSLSGSVPGLSFNAQNRVLSGTPTQTGSFTLTYSANDGKALASTAVIMTVGNAAPTNQPPVAPTVSTLNATVGQAFSSTLPVFTDPENGPLTYAVSGRPGWLSFNAQNRVLSGIPTASGTHSLTYTATDNQNQTTPVVLTLTVSEASTLPLVGYDGYLSTVNCEVFSGWVWHRDKPNLPLTVEFLDGTTIASATLIDKVLADVFRQDLKNANKGNGNHSYSFPVPQRLKDNQTHTIWARVEGTTYVLRQAPRPLTCEGPATPPTNQPPVAPTLSTLNATVGQAFSSTLPVFTDPNTDPLTYSLSGSVPGLSFNVQNRVLSGTPTQTGSFTLTYSANDGKALASTAVIMTVGNAAPTNQPPVAPTVPTLNATVGQAFSSTLPVFTDPENGPLTYAVSGRPGWLSFNSGNRVLSGIPTASGTHSLTYTATDDQNQTTPVVLTLTVSEASTLPLVGYDGYLSTVKCEVFSGWVWHRDKPNLPLTVEFLDGTTIASATLIDKVLADVFRQDLKNANKGNGNHSYSFPVPQRLKDNQTHTIWARVEGTTYVLRQAPRPLTCEGPATPPTNQPPVAPTLSTLNAAVGQAFSSTLPVFTDPENGPLTYAVSGRPGWLSFNSGNRILSGTPTASGTVTLTYSATDNKNASTNRSITLTVNPAPAVSGNFEGFLDIVNCSQFAGWVWNRNQPDAAVTIEFLEGSSLATANFIGTTSANIFRQDLKDAGKGNGVHGYSFTVPQSLKNNQQRTIWARVQYNSYVLMWSPKTLTCAPNQRLSAENSDPEASQLVLTPNPTTGLMKARFQLPENQKAQLQVTDLTGRILQRRDILGEGQPQEETLDLSPGADGLYFIHLKTDRHIRSGRVLLHR